MELPLWRVLATIRFDDLSGDVAAGVGCEKDGWSDQFVGSTQTAAAGLTIAPRGRYWSDRELAANSRQAIQCMAAHPPRQRWTNCHPPLLPDRTDGASAISLAPETLSKLDRPESRKGCGWRPLLRTVSTICPHYAAVRTASTW